MVNRLKKALEENDYIFNLSGLVDYMKASGVITFDPDIMTDSVVYDPVQEKAFYKFHDIFLDFAKRINIPMIFYSNTWRFSYDRIKKTGVPLSINKDTINSFNKWNSGKSDLVLLAAQFAPAGDCYKPSEALDADEAEIYHSWQIQELVETNIDYLVASTMPSVEETVGISRIMEKYDMPYVISYVIDNSGKILDGTSICDAIYKIDSIAIKNPPIGYMVNCSYPSFFNVKNMDKYSLERFIAFKANASSKNISELDSCNEPQCDSINNWVAEMIDIHKKTNIKILSGCCGTNIEYLELLHKKLNGLP
jgi:homocysteine S-methyltransferase